MLKLKLEKWQLKLAITVHLKISQGRQKDNSQGTLTCTFQKKIAAKEELK